jgi:hypothetical protein
MALTPDGNARKVIENLNSIGSDYNNRESHTFQSLRRTVEDYVKLQLSQISSDDSKTYKFKSLEDDSDPAGFSRLEGSPLKFELVYTCNDKNVEGISEHKKSFPRPICLEDVEKEQGISQIFVGSYLMDGNIYTVQNRFEGDKHLIKMHKNLKKKNGVDSIMGKFNDTYINITIQEDKGVSVFTLSVIVSNAGEQRKTCYLNLYRVLSHILEDYLDCPEVDVTTTITNMIIGQLEETTCSDQLMNCLCIIRNSLFLSTTDAKDPVEYLRSVSNSNVFPPLSDMTKSEIVSLLSMITHMIYRLCTRISFDDRDALYIKSVRKHVRFYKNLIRRHVIQQLDRNGGAAKSPDILFKRDIMDVQESVDGTRGNKAKPGKETSESTCATANNLQCAERDHYTVANPSSSTQAHAQLGGSESQDISPLIFQSGYLDNTGTTDGKNVGKNTDVPLNVLISNECTKIKCFEDVITVIKNKTNQSGDVIPTLKLFKDDTDILKRMPGDSNLTFNGMFVGFASRPYLLDKVLMNLRLKRLVDMELSFSYDPDTYLYSIRGYEGRLMAPFFYGTPGELVYIDTLEKKFRGNSLRDIKYQGYGYCRHIREAGLIGIQREPTTKGIHANQMSKAASSDEMGSVTMRCVYTPPQFSPLSTKEHRENKKSLKMFIQVYVAFLSHYAPMEDGFGSNVDISFNVISKGLVSSGSLLAVKTGDMSRSGQVIERNTPSGTAVRAPEDLRGDPKTPLMLRHLGGLTVKGCNTTAFWSQKSCSGAGQKLCFPFGQKGTVCTNYFNPQKWVTAVGQNGETNIVNLIINPHSFPTRMTVGVVFNSLVHKFVSMNGGVLPTDEEMNMSLTELYEKILDISNHEDTDKGALDDIYDYRGKYIGKAFCCPVSLYMINRPPGYHLQHCSVTMGEDNSIIKVNHDKITGQPMSGRKHNGGQRQGHMEVDAYTASGMVTIVKQFIVNYSDASIYKICVSCFSLLHRRATSCTRCDRNKSLEFSETILPKAATVFSDHVSALGCDLRFG